MYQDKEISEDRYFDMIGAVPPVRIKTINGETFKAAFALGEIYSRINTPEGVKEAYLAFYQKGDFYFEVDGLVYFTEPGMAVRVNTAAMGADPVRENFVTPVTKKDAVIIEGEISRYTILQVGKRISLLKKIDKYQVIVTNTDTGDMVIEYPETTQKTAVAKDYIDAIGKYGLTKIVSQGAFTTWIKNNGLHSESLQEYATERGVILNENYKAGGKIKKTSPYPRKGFVLEQSTDEPKKVTNVFINTDIFVNGGDYILGGFDLPELDKIEIEGDSTLLNPVKVRMLFRERIIKAIEKFRQEVESNITARGGDVDNIDADFDGEISNLMETYLYIKIPPSTTTETIADLIINSESAFSWLNTIEGRISKFTSVITFNQVTINKIDESKVTIDDAEDNTHNATLEQILEQLHSITENVI